MKRFLYHKLLVRILCIIVVFIIQIFISSAFTFGNQYFRLLRANPLEARVGTMYQFDDNKLRLDIGNSIDLQTFNLSDSLPFSLGTDFFTLTRLRSEGKLKFPVETADFYFGINGAIKHHISPTTEWSIRLRVAHISSHLVDGYASDNVFVLKKPFVYSREFAEVITAVEFFNQLRLYGGLTFLWATQPRRANRFIPQLGADGSLPLSASISLEFGYDFKLIGVDDSYLGTHSAQAGLFLETSNHKGYLLSMFAYRGRSVHGMFYDQNDAYNGIGFQVIF